MREILRIDPLLGKTRAKTRVAAYCRVSSSSADQLNSYAHQINVYQTLISSRPQWELVEIFADEGITGTSAVKRQEFMRMIKMCEQKKIDLIVTKSVSRFARNVKEALEYVRRLKLIGVGVMFEKEGINTGSLADEMLLNTFAAIAQEESTSISQNLRLANKKRMADGDFRNAAEPYGFERIEGRLVPYSPEADVVREIYRCYLNGFSTGEIAKKLNERKVPTKKDCGKWSSYRIGYILANERNIGDSVYQKSFTTGFPFKRKKNRGEEDQYYSTETHEGIVDRETFHRVQMLLEKRREENARKTEITEYPFTGKIRCAKCGAILRRRVIRGRERWCCSAHVEGSAKCDAHYVQTDRLESGFITMINKLRFGSKVLENIEANYLKIIRLIKKTDEAERSYHKDIAELNGQLLMLDQLRGKGYLAQDVYQQKAKEIEKKIADLKSTRSVQSSSELDDNLKEIRRLKARLEELTDPMTSFDGRLFSEIVVSGTLSTDDELTLQFIGGLKFSERI